MGDAPVAILIDEAGNYKGTAGYPLKTDPTGTTTQPMSAAALPLPAGAATEGGNLATLASKDFATQTTLALIKAKTDAIPADPAKESGKLTTIDGHLDTNLSTRALESGGNLATLAGKDFATQTTLALIKAKTDSIPADPSKESGKLTTIDGHLDVNLSTRATETTLLAADGRLTTIDSVLDAIKDTAGIKKITDSLPAGTNEIGKVAQGTKGAGANAWPNVLYDASGNAVGVVLDGAVYRIQTDGKVAVGSSALVHLDAIDTASGRGRMKATLYTPDGDAVSFASTPPSPASIVNAFVKNAGSESLLVNGSGTPVVFTYSADALKDISLQEIKFTIVANSIAFGGTAFGAAAGPLANGLLVEIVSNGITGTLYNLLLNESFVNFASPGGFEWVVSSKDLCSSSFVVGGGLKLKAGTADRVRVTVRDNLGAAGVYFKCFVKGNLLA